MAEGRLRQELQGLIDQTTNRELECRAYLTHVRDLLIYPDYADHFVETETERIEYLGRSDYIIIADVHHSGDCCRRAYLWELKAPQCFIYEEDTRTRLRPTQEFVDAENQLLNYYFALKENSVFKAQFGIVSSSDISLGGIIIGCKRTKVRGNFTEEQKVDRYNIAKRVKDQLYDGKIKLRTWDEIYDNI